MCAYPSAPVTDHGAAQQETRAEKRGSGEEDQGRAAGIGECAVVGDRVADDPVLVVLVIGLDKKVFNNIADKTFDNTIYKTDKKEKSI